MSATKVQTPKATFRAANALAVESMKLGAMFGPVVYAAINATIM